MKKSIKIQKMPEPLQDCHCLQEYGLLDLVPDEIYLIDPDTWQYVFVNAAACRNLQFAPEEVAGAHAASLGFNPALVAALKACLTAGASDPMQMEVTLRRKDGSLYPANLWARLSQVNGLPMLLLVAADQTRLRKTEEQLAFLAQFDGLTGLPNRTLFQDRLSQAILRAERQQRQMALLFINIDRFREINDMLGRDGGDGVLRQAAERMQACCRPGETLARLSGDEFTLILEGITHPDDAGLAAQKILDGFNEPFPADGAELFLTASIGIAVHPLARGGVNVKTGLSLVERANSAMLRAKNSYNAYRFYSAEAADRNRERIRLKNQLQHGIERNEFFLEYQPQVRVGTGEIIGCEALIRWRHPEFGVVPPAQFIPLAEESGLIIPIGVWALETACRQGARWLAAGLPAVRIAVNLSARQLKYPALEEDIRTILRRTGFPHHYLELEITEGVLIENLQEIRQVLANIKAAGVSVALDDFGTGYSSLSYLRDLPLSTLKVDGSFTRRIADSRTGAIIQAMITVAHELSMVVIAEGIETEGQYAALAAWGCDAMQGYLFALPVGTDAMADLLARQPYRLALQQQADGMACYPQGEEGAG